MNRYYKALYDMVNILYVKQHILQDSSYILYNLTVKTDILQKDKTFNLLKITQKNH